MKSQIAITPLFWIIHTIAAIEKIPSNYSVYQEDARIQPLRFHPPLRGIIHTKISILIS